MTEMQVSISKFNAAHLSKLASSPVSLSQLHQLTTKSTKKSTNKEVDTELLQTVREKILKKPEPEIKLEDDKCALIFTHHKISSMEQRFKTKKYIDMVKESYYNFRKATIYDQRLQDLRYAINEGLNQEFDLNADTKYVSKESSEPELKRPHAVFKELFIDNQLDSYDHELMMNDITKLQ